MSGYCLIAPGHPVHGHYHDHEYGFPQREERELFERLILEINQAGLSWLTMLKKQQGFRDAYHNFSIAKVARYGERDRKRLLNDAGIIRNKLKVNAAIENAKRIQSLQQAHGSFAAWLAAHHPMAKPDWMKLFKKTFVFTGGEIVGEFLMSIGYLPGAHALDCPVHKKIARLKPAWMAAEKKGMKY